MSGKLDLDKPLVTMEDEECWLYDKGDGYTFQARVPDGQVHIYYADGTPYHNEDNEPTVQNGSVKK